MRQSVAPNRASYALQPAGSQAVVNAKLLEKKKEYDAVAALERASTLYLQRLEGLSEDCNVMADAGQAHGKVLEQWPKMFEIMSLFLTSRQNSEAQADGGAQEQYVVEEQLVRIPIEELQQTTS